MVKMHKWISFHSVDVQRRHPAAKLFSPKIMINVHDGITYCNILYEKHTVHHRSSNAHCQCAVGSVRPKWNNFNSITQLSRLHIPLMFAAAIWRWPTTMRLLVARCVHCDSTGISFLNDFVRAVVVSIYATKFFSASSTSTTSKNGSRDRFAGPREFVSVFVYY